MSRMSTQREREQHKSSWLTACGPVRRRSSGAERCSRLSLPTASHRVWHELS
jgi:hypothetical protein